MGAFQKGRNDLRIASLRRDKHWVGLAREAAVVGRVAVTPAAAARARGVRGGLAENGRRCNAARHLFQEGRAGAAGSPRRRLTTKY